MPLQNKFLATPLLLACPDDVGAVRVRMRCNVQIPLRQLPRDRSEINPRRPRRFVRYVAYFPCLDADVADFPISPTQTRIFQTILTCRDGLKPRNFVTRCYMSRGSFGEVGVMEFGLNRAR